MRRAPEVAELEEAIDHAGDTLSDLLAREAVRLRNTRIRYQLGLSHFPPTISFVPPLRSAERGTGGEPNKTGPLPWEAGPICVARAVYKLVEHHPMPATTAPQPRPLPEGQGHIIRQGGQQQVVVWCAIMSLLFTRRVPPCQPYFRVVDRDWADRLVTAHAAYPFSSPAPSSPPVAWGEPEAYAKVTSRAQHLESIADADPPGPASCFSGTPELRGLGSANDSERHDVPTTRFLHTTTPRPAERPHGARGADPPQRRRHPDSSGRQGLSPRRVPAGHRSQDPQATEHRGDARPRQPGLGPRRRGLGGGARGGRGRAARHRARPGAGGCGGAQDAARGGTPARASPGGSVGIRAAGRALDRAARACRRVRTLVRRDRGVPTGRRGRHRGQYRHGCDPRGGRPRG